MPDTITAEEREAINAAIAAGKIKRIPRGHSAFAVQYNPETRALTYTASGASTAWRRSAAKGAENSRRRNAGPRTTSGIARKEQSQAVQDRIAKVKVLVDQGMHRSQIMQAMPGLTEAQLTYAFRNLGVAPGRNVDVVADRRKRLAALLDKGMDGPAILAAMNINKVVLTKDLQALGRKLPPRQRGQPQIEERRKKVADLAAKGLGRNEIANALNVGFSTIDRDVKDMGISLERKVGKTFCPKAQERRDRIRALHAQRLTVREIAEAIGQDPKATRRDLAIMGLKAEPAINRKR